MQNMRGWDRWLRAVLAIGLLQAAYFWLGGTPRWVAGALAAAMALTALSGFCPIYRVTGLSLAGQGRRSTGLRRGLAALVLLGLLLGGSYGSALVTRKIFLEDFNGMNHFYKQTLFLTGKGQREAAVRNLDDWARTLAAFERKYADYRPFVIRQDLQFSTDLQNVTQLMQDTDPLVRSGDLHQAHLELEKVRPVFQEMFKRNGLSLLAVALVDFHDAMEQVLEAAQVRDAAKVLALYAGVSEKLQVVESQAQDAEIQAIRSRLDAVRAAAEAGAADQLPSLSDQLKSSFVKVYLQRG